MCDRGSLCHGTRTVKWVSLRRALLIAIVLLCALAVVVFFYLREAAPNLAEEPTGQAPVDALVVIDFQVAAAIEKSPIAEYVRARVAELPPACGDSPLSYLKSVTAFLAPVEDTHPDWGLVAPHLPPSDVLKPCLDAMMGEQSISLEPFSWATLIELGLRWGGTVASSDHQIVSPVHGGLVIGETNTVANVLEVARGNQPALASELEAQLSKDERVKLSRNLPDAFVRAVLLPPSAEKLRGYWATRLPGLWPSLRVIRAATAGLAIDRGLRFRAVVLAKSGAAAELQKGVDDVLSRARLFTQLIPGLDAIAMGAAEVEGDWLTIDLTVPLSAMSLLSRTAPPIP